MAENNQIDNSSIFLQIIEKGEQQGLLSFNEDRSKITYHCGRDYTTGFKNPEEKVRASYYTQLILEYKYPRELIDIEVIVPRRTPEDRADIIVYSENDRELKNPYIVIEVKKDGVSDAEFKQAIEQGFGNGNNFGSTEYVVIVAGTTKRHFALKGFPSMEHYSG